ncbi:hypothetical protein J4Q44_G00110330, partial [Coregonus suidteri]
MCPWVGWGRGRPCRSMRRRRRRRTVTTKRYTRRAPHAAAPVPTAAWEGPRPGAAGGAPEGGTGTESGNAAAHGRGVSPRAPTGARSTSPRGPPKSPSSSPARMKQNM